MALGHLVGVHLKAERVELHLAQAILHHLQSRHFLGHEEHTLAFVEGIGDHVGDSLALARSRRTVEDEAAIHTRHEDGLELRRVGGQRYGGIVGRILLVADAHVDKVALRLVEFETLGDERLDDGVALHLLAVVVNVVPHHKLREREEAEHTFLHHIPALLRLDGSTHHGEDASHVDAVVVGRQRVEVGHVHLKLLAQHLRQRSVEDGVFLTRPDHIAVSPLANQLHRQEQQRGVTGPLAPVRLVPFEQSEDEEERVGTIFFQRRARLAKQASLRESQRFIVKVGDQSLATQAGIGQFAQILLVADAVVDAPAVGLRADPRGLADEFDVGTILQLVFERVDMIGDKGNHLLSDAHVEEVVAEREVEELSLPDLRAREHFGLRRHFLLDGLLLAHP